MKIAIWRKKYFALIQKVIIQSQRSMHRHSSLCQADLNQTFSFRSSVKLNRKSQDQTLQEILMLKKKLLYSTTPTPLRIWFQVLQLNNPQLLHRLIHPTIVRKHVEILRILLRSTRKEVITLQLSWTPLRLGRINLCRQVEKLLPKRMLRAFYQHQTNLTIPFPIKIRQRRLKNNPTLLRLDKLRI